MESVSESIEQFKSIKNPLCQDTTISLAQRVSVSNCVLITNDAPFYTQCSYVSLVDQLPK